MLNDNKMIYVIICLLIIMVIILFAKFKLTKDNFVPGNGMDTYNYITDWQQFDIINKYLVDDSGAVFPTVLGLKNQYINK